MALIDSREYLPRDELTNSESRLPILNILIEEFLCQRAASARHWKPFSGETTDLDLHTSGEVLSYVYEESGI